MNNLTKINDLLIVHFY